MAKMIDAKPSYMGEGKVWDSLKKHLPESMVVYNNRELNGREYDFCILVENLGILIIEVKGWLSDKITVNGVDDIEVEGYAESVTSPKKQARAYRFAMLNKIKERYYSSPLVLDMVCYPFITKEEYLDSNLNIISEEEYTLFKEDLEDKESLNIKINRIFGLNSFIVHDDFSTNLMLDIRRYYEPKFYIDDVDYINTLLPYSKLLIYPDTISDIEIENVIKEYFQGVKTIVFLNDSENLERVLRALNLGLKSRNIEYKKNNLALGYNEGIPENKGKDSFRIFNFELYRVAGLKDITVNTIRIEEGNVEKGEMDILRRISNECVFNVDQYIVEHASTEKNILVEASAGTGKTYSMVSRMAYLCNKKNSPIVNLAEEVAMVTFTNDAAINMKKRLKQLFVNYFILTGKEEYLRFVEDVDRSHISTIHSFVIEIMREESIRTGLGTNFSISSNEYDRGRIYDDLLGNFINEKVKDNPGFINQLPIPVYELKKKLMGIADKLLNKSVNMECVRPAEMGRVSENNIPYFNDLLMRVVFPAEAMYVDLIKSNNSIDLKGCLVEFSKVLSSIEGKMGYLHYRFLFIDEFQDTDDVQIDVFKTMQKYIAAECRLFVVGDLKQSIYRFRGASLSAFDRLQKANESMWQRYVLKKNYRTDGRLLKIFNAIFENMSSKDMLPYSGVEDRISSDVITEAKDDELMVCLPCHGKKTDALHALLNTSIASEKEKIEELMKTTKLSKEERTVAVLVRSNWQVDAVVKGAEDMDFVIETSAGGDLFNLESTLDLYKFLLAVTHHMSPLYLINFIESNYTNLTLNYQSLSGLSEKEKLAEINRVLDEYFVKMTNKTWEQLVKDLYYEPVLYVLKNVFESLRPWVNYSSSYDKQRHYVENYEYLIEQIIDFYRIDTLTLNQVLEYLRINILTGQQKLSRNTVTDDNSVHILCTTIHKSKGLEYGTVILPFTSEDISDLRKAKLEANYSESKLSYSVVFDNGIVEKNSNFSEDKEVDEQVKEEARILYVALTRAIRKCIWIKDLDRNQVIDWATLLEG